MILRKILYQCGLPRWPLYMDPSSTGLNIVAYEIHGLVAAIPTHGDAFENTVVGASCKKPIAGRLRWPLPLLFPTQSIYD